MLPLRLSQSVDERGATLILAHELAHLRRRDHWVRGIELIVSVVYWWNPLVRFVRWQIHRAEELCCDAWVCRAFPAETRRYAQLVLETAESLRAPQVGAGLLPASPFLRSHSLKARIEMILQNRFAPRASRNATIAIALFAMLLLPSFADTSKPQAPADSQDRAEATDNKAAPATSEFPYAVKFEQGATRFEKGDEISIDEIRGTADTFTPGNIYWIKGTYKLGSHDRAALSAYTTAADAKNGTSYSFAVQSTVVDRGSGTFTLFLPMPYRGWPHVSFYPTRGPAEENASAADAVQLQIDRLWQRVDAARIRAQTSPTSKAYADDLERQLIRATGPRVRAAKSGESFGGNYFGTGEWVLKRWWGSPDPKAIEPGKEKP